MKFSPSCKPPLDVVGLRRYSLGKAGEGIYSKEFEAIYAWAGTRSSSFLAASLAEAYEHIELLEARLAHAERRLEDLAGGDSGS